MVLATCRLDVNHAVCDLLGVRKASFARAEQTRELTGMMIGGVTPFGLPDDLPLYIDARVMEQDERRHRRWQPIDEDQACPAGLLRLPGARVVEGLANVVEAARAMTRLTKRGSAHRQGRPGVPPHRRHQSADGARAAEAGSAFESLLSAIVFQQLAGAAARTIHGRVIAVLGGAPVAPETVLAAEPGGAARRRVSPATSSRRSSISPPSSSTARCRRTTSTT